MATRQLPLFGTQARAKRACFYSLHPSEKTGKFSAYTPKAMKFFSAKYGIPIVDRPEDLAAFDVVFFSLISFREFYDIARLAQHKRAGQEWIAGGNACVTPGSIGWIMDYVWIGDCHESFARILSGERDLPGMYDSRHPERPVHYVDEDIHLEPIAPSNIEMSKGCPRRCLFCIHPWRHRYQEAPKEFVVDFIEKHKNSRIGLMSNSSDDVSYYDEVSTMLATKGKSDMTMSNAVQSFTEQMAKERKSDMLFGVEGMSERLRWIVNKPISQAVLREKVDICLRNGVKTQLIYQFNLPGEDESDYAEFASDVEYFRSRYTSGSVAMTFIPNQPSAHTPFQWVEPTYSVAMQERLMGMRASLIGSGKTGLGMYLPSPLGAGKWFAQVIAEWIPITPQVAAVVDRLPSKLSVPAMVEWLASRSVTLPEAFFNRNRDTVFPWAHVVTSGDDADKWKRYLGMQRKLASDRFKGGPLPQEFEAVASEVA
jgi:hypothetical protein